jgi:mono/diheme cytochrome c family protein
MRACTLPANLMKVGVSLVSFSPVPRTRRRWLTHFARAATLATSVTAVVFVAGCDRPPSPDSLPEWTQSDHHSTDDGKLGMAAPAPAAAPGAGQRDQARAEVDQLVELTWRQQCTTCHGPTGHGDGQMGPMVQAPDLTLADWQTKTSDAEMAAIIKAGRNRMPAFNLPDSVLAGLVARIRSLKAPH